MPRRWQHLVQHDRVRRCPVDDHLHRATFVVAMARWKNRRVAVISRRGETNTSMTWPN
jgi:hypothetical protein